MRSPRRMPPSSSTPSSGYAIPQNLHRRPTRCDSSDAPTTPGTAPAARTEPLRILPLGGVGEIGKNLTVFEYGDEIVVIDCGLAFPDEEMFGIDLVIPDVTYLKERRHKVKAFLITHAHEDHVGGLPYVLPSFPGVPVYASTLARGPAGHQDQGAQAPRQPAAAPSSRVRPSTLGAFTASGFRIGHSIPDAMGICLRTPLGNIIHTGDFKFDQTPGRRQGHRLPRAGPPGQRGRAVPAVRLDARREHPATPPPSGPWARPSGASWKASRVASSWPPSRATSRASSRCSTPPASSDARWRSSAAPWSRTRASPRTWATSTGAPASRCPRTASRTSPTTQMCIATTGAQGEPMAGLARMANRDHRFVEIVPGDTVIVSASPIPGNEEYVARTIDNLFKVGANVYYHAIRHAHVSGHAQPGGAQADAQPDQAHELHPGPRRVPDAGPARPHRERDGCLGGEHLHHRERPADRVLPRRARPPGHARRGRPGVRGRAVRGRGRRCRPARPTRARQRRHVPDRGHRGQADRQPGRPAGDRDPRLRGHPRAIAHLGCHATDRPRSSRDPATATARSACSRRRSRTACRSTCTTRPVGGRWCCRWWSRSDGVHRQGESQQLLALEPHVRPFPDGQGQARTRPRRPARR